MTTTKASRAKSQFRARLEEVGLSQRAFARLLGVSAVTVNRWCSKREDALAVPQYARTILASYGAMTGDQRLAFLKERGITEGLPPPFEAIPPPRKAPQQ